ncbi:TPA: hypothetical protein HA244_05395 [Candidatus Micrarchaeota archaeon]|nr:hypothetical protein [Candidatus Micrarchaeota archaeon]
MQKLVEKLVRNGLHHFTIAGHPTEPLSQIRLYFAMPKTFRVERENVVFWRKATPLTKPFYSKAFWAKKKTWNPFNRSFWTSRPVTRVPEEVEPEGMHRIVAQVERACNAGQLLHSELSERFNTGNHVAVFPYPVSGNPANAVFDPAYVVVLPQDRKGQEFIEKLARALRDKKVSDFSPSVSFIEAMKNVSGKGYDVRFVSLDTPPRGKNGKEIVH